MAAALICESGCPAMVRSSGTTPGSTKAGTPSKASYVLADGVADRTKDASAEMLDKHPLYPGLELS